MPNNCHFDTTRANLEYLGIEAVDLVIAEGLQPALIYPFKGNIDLIKVEALLKAEGDRIPFGMITVTNNTGGGQPVSMANIRSYSAMLKKYGKPLIMDVCRFSENAMFIKMREPGYENISIKAIVQEMFSYCDGCTMSAKKDGMVNIGGFIVLRSEQWMDAVRNGLIMMEGFPTYGGLAGRDLEALAVGLVEGMDEDYLRYRLRTAEYLGERLEAAGVGFVKPTGGHAVYIDAKTVLPNMPIEQYPAWALCNAAGWSWILLQIWTQVGTFEAASLAGGHAQSGAMGLLFVLIQGVLIVAALPVAVPLAMFAGGAAIIIGTIWLAAWIAGGVLGFFHPWLTIVPIFIAGIVLIAAAWAALGEDL